MGNCLRHQSSLQWAGDDWGSAVSDQRAEKAMKMEEEGLLGLGGGKIGFITSSAASSTTEIKIKITKKQLEELLRKPDVKELSVHQVLAHLMINVSGCSSGSTDTDHSDRYHHETHQRSWRPALQSIPELN